MKYLVTLASVLILSACASTGSKQTDIDNSALTVEPEWVVELPSVQGQLLRMTPVLVDDSVLVSSVGGEIYKISLDDGELISTRDLKLALNTGAAIYNNSLLFGGDAQLIAIDRENGDLLWQSDVSSEIITTPVIENGIAVVRTVDGKLYAFDAASGKQIWNYQWQIPLLTLRGESIPLIAYGAVFIGTPTGQVIALDLKTGKLYWESVVASAKGRSELDRMIDIDAPIVESNGILFVAAHRQGLTAITAETGQLIWRRDIDLNSDILIYQGHLVVADESGTLWSLDEKTGATFWKQTDFEGTEFNGVDLIGKHLVLRGNDSSLVWIDPVEGKTLASTTLQRWFDYFPVKDEFYGFTENFEESRAILASTISAKNRVVALDQRGILHAFSVTQPETVTTR